jgi:hypothetical protein
MTFAIVCPENASRFTLRLTDELIRTLEPVGPGEGSRYPFCEVRAAEQPARLEDPFPTTRPGCALAWLALTAGLLAVLTVGMTG